jgi:hypothetical protein
VDDWNRWVVYIHHMNEGLMQCSRRHCYLDNLRVREGRKLGRAAASMPLCYHLAVRKCQGARWLIGYMAGKFLHEPAQYPDQPTGEQIALVGERRSRQLYRIPSITKQFCVGRHANVKLVHVIRAT